MKARVYVETSIPNLANANKFEHIRHINTLLGLFVPILTTPYTLMCEYKEDEK